MQDAKVINEQYNSLYTFDTEKIKDILFVLYPYDTCILTPALIALIVKELIQTGLYRPMIVSDTIKRKWKEGINLDDAETEQVFNDNPQHHKEAGFEKGWPSRFDTWFKIAKELGFVYYWQYEKIVFSESGKMLIDKEKRENEQMVFANAFAKYQRHNPFRSVMNKNVPLVLLIETIQFLNADPDFNNVGISCQELPILLCWQNDDAKSLYLQIKAVRTKYRYTPSDEVILDICYDLLDATKRDDSSIMNDYPDDFIRKMRLTGLISLRGGGRFIDINHKEEKAVDYILKNYKNYKNYNKTQDFFEYIGTIDFNLIETLSVYKAADTTTTTLELQKWVDYYSWETIKTEMLNLAEKKSSKDNILKIIEAPLRLEFLTTLALLKKLPKVNVKPNFISDDEGLPTSFAQGGNPDIECKEQKNTILVEVTLLTGTQQHIRESYSIQRHLETFINNGHNAFVLFISPRVFIDTCRNAAFVKF